MDPEDTTGPTFELLGWPPDGPKLRLDHERFSYAGKFVMTNTGKAVARTNDGSQSADRHSADCQSIDRRSTDRSTGSETNPDRSAPSIDESDAATDDIVAAASFNADRTDASRLWIRYVTVARERRGEGIGPRLAAFVRERAVDRGYDRIRIAVNNPFAYEALYRAGFAFTGETTGIAELVLEYDADGGGGRAIDTYRDGLERFSDRDLAPEEESFIEEKRRREPPAWRE